MVVQLGRHGYSTESRQKVVSSNPGLAIRQLKYSLSTSPAVSGYLFRVGEDKVAKGEGWAPANICCVDLKSHTPTSNRLWGTFYHASALKFS